MLVQFWGTRGSIATPGPNTARFGGNTSCVSIQARDGTLIVLDCGTGARELGNHLVQAGDPPRHINLLIGHTHWDHIQGFPFFLPIFLPNVELNVYAPAGFQRSLENTLAGQMQYAYFPVKLQDLASRIHYNEIGEGFFRVGEVLVETQHLNHTAPTLGFRLSSDDATVVFSTDHEPYWRSANEGFHHPGDQRHIDFLQGADLVIHDAQYTEEEYAEKHGWGHSSIEYATDVALAAGVRRLALYHHDPLHGDSMMTELEERARTRVGRRDLDVFGAAEGLIVDVRGNGRPSPRREQSALTGRPVTGARVLVITSDEADTAAVSQALAEDRITLIPASTLETALFRTGESQPDLVIVGARIEGAAGAEIIEPLRTRFKRPNLPVLLLTDSFDSATLLRGRNVGATDYLAKPFSPPMLRARVQAWLDRTRQVDARQLQGVRPPESLGDMMALLRSTALLSLLDTDQLETLAREVDIQSYWPGQTIIEQGEVADSVYIVTSGKVRIVESVTDSLRVEMLLGELGPGEVFGELAVFCDQPRSATVLAAEKCNCVVIPNARFLQLIESNAEIGKNLLRVLSERIYEANRLLARHAPDPLTGLAGRRAFHEQYRRQAARARRQSLGMMFLLVDIEQLKQVNDVHGYHAGDEVLRTMADALLGATRSTDFVARYGGDEFVAILEDIQPDDSEVVIRRVREKLTELADRRGLIVRVHCNLGLSFAATPPESPEELLREADRDLIARKSGRSAPPVSVAATPPRRERRSDRIPAAE